MDEHRNVYVTYNYTETFYQYHVASDGSSMTLLRTYHCGSDAFGFMHLLADAQLLLVSCGYSVVALSTVTFQPVTTVPIVPYSDLESVVQTSANQVLTVQSLAEESLTVVSSTRSMFRRRIST